MTVSRADKPAVLEQAKAHISAGDSIRRAADRIGVPESTLRGWLKGWTPAPRDVASPEGIERQGDSDVEVTGRGPTPAGLLEKHGLNPDEWVVTSVRVSEWGNPDEPMFQLRVNATRKDSLLQVPDPAGWTPPNLNGIEQFSHGSVVFLADQHAPYHNRAAHQAVLNFLQAEQPKLIVNLGDVGDWSMISRHRTHPRFMALANETTDAVARIFYDQRTACPDADIIFIPGNHDARLLYAIQDFKPELYGVRPGQLPTETIPPADSLNFNTLYRLDDLGIKLIDEDWKLASYPVVPELTARHGYLTGNNSERKLLETHGRSQVHGHDHRGSVIYRTKHDPLDIRVVMSCGTLAEVKPDGLGYQPDPDWTPGIGVGHIWDDDMFVLGFAPFIHNNLLLPDGRRFDTEEN